MPFSLLQHPVFACGMSILEKHQGHSVSCFKPGFLIGLNGQVGHFTERMKQDSAAHMEGGCKRTPAAVGHPSYAG